MTWSANAQSYLNFQKKAEQAFEANNLEGALKNISKAEKFAKIDVGEGHLDYALIIHDFALYEYFAGNFVSGIEKMQKACDIVKLKKGDENKDYALYLSELGAIYYGNGEVLKAKSINKATIALQEKISGKESIDYAIEVNNLALLLKELGDVDSSLAVLRSCEDVFEENRKAYPLEYGLLCNNLGDLYQEKEQYLIAEDQYKQASKTLLKVEGEQGYNYGITAQNLGNLYTEMNRYEDALRQFKQAEAIKAVTNGTESYEYSKILNDLANVYHHVGNYILAEQNYLQSLNIKTKTVGETHPSFMRGQNNLSLLYKDLGRIDEAYKLIQSALTKIELQRESQILLYATILQNVSSVYRELFYIKGQKEYINKAKDYLLETIGLFENSYSEDNIGQHASLLNNLALIYADINDYAKSEEVYLKAIELLENKPNYATILLDVYYNLGLLHFQQKKLESAETYLKDAVKLAEKNFNVNNLEQIYFYSNLAQVQAELGNTKSASENFEKSNTIISNAITNQLDYLSEIEKGQFYHNLKIPLSYFKRFAYENSNEYPELLEELYNIHLITKSFLIRSSQQLREKILASNDESIIFKYHDWKASREYLNKLYSLSNAEILEKDVNISSLEDKVNLLEKELSLAFSGFKTELPSLRQIQKALSDGEAAIEIIRVPHYGQDKEDFDITYLALIAIKESNVPEVIVFEEGRKIEGQYADTYFYCMEEEIKDTLSYNRLWAPLGNALKNQGAKEVFISMEGKYSVFNLNTLFNSQTNEYVLDEVDLRVLSSTANIKEDKDIVPNNSKIAKLFGYPNYYLDISTIAVKDNEKKESISSFALQRSAVENVDYSAAYYLSDLPGTKQEVNEINKILTTSGWTTDIYMEGAATEQKVKEIDNASLLHIATHGYFDYDEDINLEATRVSGKVELQHPLLRSGLILAGAGNTFKLTSENIQYWKALEDGVLTAHEVMGLNCSNTELVVLSACLSGVGSGKLSDAEGYWGLLKAFSVAGAKNILTSYWPVDDNATRDLMIAFYTTLAGGGTVQSAFNLAQKKTRENYPHPYYWGAFGLMGR